MSLRIVGAWRSPVAHSLGVREVGRSNRLAPTISFFRANIGSLGLQIFVLVRKKQRQFGAQILDHFGDRRRIKGRMF